MPEAVGVGSGPTNEQRQAEARAAQNSVMDFTRNIQRKKEKEMAELQFVGGESVARASSRCWRRKGRPQRSVPVRQRKEVQKMLRKLALLAGAALPAGRGDFARPDRRVREGANPSL